MNRSVGYLLLAIASSLWGNGTNSCSLSAQQSDKKDAMLRDVRKLQGVWYHASREEKGKQVVGEVPEVLIAFRENVVVFKKGMDVSQVCALKNINAVATPKTFDLVITDGPNEGMTIKAIYEIKDDFFRYCGGVDVRPNSFTTTPDDKTYIYCSSYKRMSKK